MAVYSVGEHYYFFPNDENKKAKITFWSPKNISLSHLTLGTTGDMNIVEVTGISENQIKRSLRNAVGTFNWEVDQNVINLVVMEADNHKDIDICEAVFGTEFELLRGNRHS